MHLDFKRVRDSVYVKTDEPKADWKFVCICGPQRRATEEDIADLLVALLTHACSVDDTRDAWERQQLFTNKRR